MGPFCTLKDEVISSKNALNASGKLACNGAGISSLMDSSLREKLYPKAYFDSLTMFETARSSDLWRLFTRSESTDSAAITRIIKP
jgi:hypothetical protein